MNASIAGTPALRRAPIIGCVMLTMALISIEATVVSTVMPAIAADLGGISIYAWVFAAFLLAQTAFTVVFGKLADAMGRRLVMLGGLVLFSAASLACGFAGSMLMLIAMRVLQGVGAGAVQPVAVTLVGDLYSPAERGRVQGWLSGVWVVSSLAGPMVGGAIVHLASWSWVFWANMPLAALAMAGFIRFLPADRPEGRLSLDLPGVILFLPAATGLLLALNALGDGDRALAGAALLVGLVCAGLFLLQERRAADPLISLSIWAHPAIRGANGVTFLSGAALMCLMTFLPIYVQAVLGHSAVVAGMTLTMATFGWPIGAFFGSRMQARVGLGPMIATGAAVMSLGSSGFLFVGPGVPLAVAGLGSLVFGFGIGISLNSCVILVQSSVERAQRGSATASTMFARTFGSATGAVLFGTLVNLGLSRANPPIGANDLADLIGNGKGVEPGLRLLLAGAIGHAFWVMLALCLGALLTALGLRRRARRDRQGTPAE